MPGPKSFTNFGGRPFIAGGVVHKKYKLDGLRVINKTGSDIAADKLVAVVGYDTTSELPKVVLADANDRTHRSIYVALDAIGNNDTGHVFKGGASAANLNTSAASAAGDPVYLSETAGGFTTTAPSTPGAAIIPVGWVTTDSSTVGEIDWYIMDPETDDRGVGEVVAATNVITAAENGKTFFLSAATEFASTLPAPALGLHYRFIVAAAPSGADYTVVTAGAPDQILAGQVYASSGGDEDSETAATATTITFVGGTSVVGDSADVWSDGTNWYARCFCNAAGGITITG